ncbi:MAG TPA: LamG domain-containing protein [Myxococcota bacterium]|nr:LamG domain-containing protein [Myxococcota bacterium]
MLLSLAALLLSTSANAMDLCQPPRVVPGEHVVLQVSGAPANARVALVRGSGPGSTCPPPLNGSCFDVANGVLLTWVRANADGFASLDVPLPANLPTGLSFGLQAGVIQGPNLLKSEPFFASTQGANDPSNACSTGNVCADQDADADSVHDVCDVCPAGDDHLDVDMDGVADACDPGPLDGLVGWWDFSGYDDKSGNGHDATLVSGAPTSGLHGDAVSLDGVEDYLTIPASPAFDLGPQLTIAAWVNPSELRGYQGIFAKSGRTGPTQDWGLYLRNDEIAVLSDYPAALRAHISVGAGITPGAWYHVAAVADADGDFVDFYLDGQFLSRAVQRLNLPMNMTDLVIGTDGGLPNDFAGVIDDVRVWDHALTEAEILDAYLAY